MGCGSSRAAAAGHPTGSTTTEPRLSYEKLALSPGGCTITRTRGYELDRRAPECTPTPGASKLQSVAAPACRRAPPPPRLAATIPGRRDDCLARCACPDLQAVVGWGAETTTPIR
jgi:hypothetical protein